MTSVSSLKKSRGTYKAQLTKFITFVGDCETNADRRIELPVRLEKLEELWVKFEKVQSQLEELENVNADPEREAFENKYYAVVTQARQWCVTLTTPQVKPAVKLPTIDLPKFNGSYAQWMSFSELFQSLIDTNTQLSNVQKLHYLKSALTDNAAKVIESVELTGPNYTVAWKLLRDRFENKKLIIHHHVQAVINAPAIQKESHSDLRQLLDNTLQHIQTLKKLEQPTDQWDTILIHILTPKLDPTTNKEWNKERADKEALPTMNDFTTFLIQRCSFLESFAKSEQSNASKAQTHVKTTNSNFKPKSTNPKESNASYSYVATTDSICPMCQGQHKIYQCKDFRSLSALIRNAEAKRLKLCYNCLKEFHGPKCTAGSCRICRKHHNTLLHLDSYTNTNNEPAVKPPNTHAADTSQGMSNPGASGVNDAPYISQQHPNATYSHYTANSPTHVLLSTAVIRMRDKKGSFHECRALLDNGSQSNFVTQELSNRLQLDKQTVNTPILGIGQSIVHSTHMTQATIKSKCTSFQRNLSFLIVQKITDQLPIERIEVTELQIPTDITLADPSFHKPDKVDILLGATIFWELLCVGQIRLCKDQPIFQKTQLGWVIAGAFNYPTGSNRAAPLQCYFSSDLRIANQLEGFWRIEEVEPPRHHSEEDQLCQEHFEATHRQEENGRFEVQLPFRSDPSLLGESKEIAKRRFLALETKLNKNPSLKREYDQFINEYIELGHATQITEPDLQASNAYYLPHHAVVKEDRITTKVRVVFDGSCKTTTGESLNDKLMVGPTIQPDLITTLLRFRQHLYAMAADITKMYRQISLAPQHRPYQRILWRWNTDAPIQIFQLNTVTYGLASSPFLAIRCLQQATKENILKYPKACNSILQDFYVDDLLTGGDDLGELLQRKQDITGILATAQFELRKWKSNEPALTYNQETDSTPVPIGEETKTLGLMWNTNTDQLQYKTNASATDQRVTKRAILSIISQIFDPLGLVGPITIQTKIILQNLWQLKTGWDESLPMDLHTKWIRWYEQVYSINKITIPRNTLCTNYRHVEIHGFCDASEAAYGACIYLRSTTTFNTYTVRLLCAKSRVSPLKRISLPRLELCGALLLTELCHKVTQSLTVPINNIHYWCITLAWIAKEPHHWNTFVANRVAEIQRLSQRAQWHHARSENNPADIISRGIDPDQLENCTLWWEEPEFLHMELQYDDLEKDSITDDLEIPEKKKNVISMLAVNEELQSVEFFQRYSSLNKLKRVTAYCLRFKNNAGFLKAQQKGPLTVKELDASLVTLIKIAQTHVLSRELHQLQTHTQVHSKSKLLSLHPFLDQAKLIRVGGRLSRGPMLHSQRHPIVLPNNHPLTTLIIRDEHYKHLHAGPQALLASIRSQYWPLAGKIAIKRVLRNCIV